MTTAVMPASHTRTYTYRISPTLSRNQKHNAINEAAALRASQRALHAAPVHPQYHRLMVDAT